MGKKEESTHVTESSARAFSSSSAPAFFSLALAFFNAFFSFFIIGVPEDAGILWGGDFCGAVSDEGSGAGTFFFFFFYLVVLEMSNKSMKGRMADLA